METKTTVIFGMGLSIGLMLGDHGTSVVTSGGAMIGILSVLVASLEFYRIARDNNANIVGDFE